MGSKRVKAILVAGTKRTSVAAPDQLNRYAKHLSEKSFGPATAKYRELGTATNLLLFNRLRSLPTRNFQSGSPRRCRTTSTRTAGGRAIASTRVMCACTIGCEHIYSLQPADRSQQPTNVRVEYENLFALGPLCGITDPETVLQASKRCDELGLDTISAGGTIAFAMECVERGWISGGELGFGKNQQLLETIESIGQRAGLGDQLAEGSRRLSETLGSEAQAIAPHVKGLEIPGYEPRALQTMALGFATTSRGADHNRSGAYEADFSVDNDRRNLQPTAAVAAVDTENRAAIMDSMILCKFLRGVFTDFYADCGEMLQLVTGWDMTAAEIETTANRIVNLRKRFNVLSGWQRQEDTLPPRLLSRALTDDERARLTSTTIRCSDRSLLQTTRLES